MPKRVKAGFIPPMLLLKTDTLPQGDSWTYQLKLDGYRAVAFKTGRKLHLRSRNNKDFSTRYPSVVRGLAKLPDATVIDGEVVAFDEEGRPSFNALQNFGSSPAPVVYYVFDLMVLGGRDLRREPLEKRRALLEKRVLPKLTAPVHHTVDLDAPLPVLIESVKAQGFEGLVAKRLDSCYEPGLRSGAWMKMRVNRGQEFVIGGYTHGTKMRCCSGITKARVSSTSRERATDSPPRLAWRCSNGSRAWRPRPARAGAAAGRWGQGLTAAKMKECTWLKPQLVAQIEFLEWTGENHLRHSRFVGLRDKKAKDVVRER